MHFLNSGYSSMTSCYPAKTGSANFSGLRLVVLAGSGIGKLSASASVPVSSRHVLVASFTADSLELVLLEGFLLSVLNSRG